MAKAKILYEFERGNLCYMILTERDFLILKEIQRWRFLLSRQVKILCGFNGQRACDRRLKKLIDAGYIERKHFIYGVPRLYFVTQKAVKLFNLEYYTQSVRIEQIEHDISVIDTAIFLINDENIESASIVTERDLKHRAGFGNPKHFPDFIYTKEEKTFCVEVELSAKKQVSLDKNIRENFKNYDVQRWFIPNDKPKIIENVKTIGQKYEVEIFSLERVKEYVRELSN